MWTILLGYINHQARVKLWLIIALIMALVWHHIVMLCVLSSCAVYEGNTYARCRRQVIYCTLVQTLENCDAQP